VYQQQQQQQEQQQQQQQDAENPFLDPPFSRIKKDPQYKISPVQVSSVYILDRRSVLLYFGTITFFHHRRSRHFLTQLASVCSRIRIRIVTIGEEGNSELTKTGDSYVAR
jgi:hypothetical protein